MMKFFARLFAKPEAPDIEKAIRQKALLVDVRTPQEYATGTAGQAVSIPLAALQGQVAKLKNKQPVIVFCRSGNRSSQAKTLLQQHGIAHVIDGGSLQNMRRLLKKMEQPV